MVNNVAATDVTGSLKRPNLPPSCTFYASRDGQARKIADYISAKLTARGVVVAAENLAEASSAATAIAGQELIVVVAAVRYGAHLKEADNFLAAYRQPARKLRSFSSRSTSRPASPTARPRRTIPI